MAFKADAAKIKRWREERYWSQEQLAELSGIGLRTVQRIETGERASQDSIKALAVAFGVDAIDLSVDTEKEAIQAAKLKDNEAQGKMRLVFYYHAISIAISVAIFVFLALLDGNWEVLKITLFFIFPLVIHGIAIVFMHIKGRHEQKYGEINFK